MVNTPGKNLSSLLAGKYGEKTKQSTRKRHQANIDNRHLVAEWVWELGALCSLQSKNKLSAEKRQEMYFLSNEDKHEWIEDYVDWEMVGARKWVEDTDPAIMQEQEDMRNAVKPQSTTRKPEKRCEEMFNAIGDSISNLASPEDEEDGEDEEDDEDTELGKLSEFKEPGWVMGTISKMVQHRKESFRQKQMRLDELTQPRWGDVADNLCERYMKYGTAKLMVAAVMKPLTDSTAAALLLTTVGELMQTLDIVPV